MNTSYRQFMDEHDEIEEAADGILADLDCGAVSAHDLSQQVEELARLVEDHVEMEDIVVRQVAEADLSPVWSDAWRDGLRALDCLKSDWQLFLSSWPQAAIERDRAGFQRAASAILPRLRERIQLETRAFYATALQTGAIDLR